MDPTYRSTITELLSVYADVDLLSMELCAARLPYAPDIRSKLELAKQIAEEREHYALQVAWLKELGVDLEEKLPREMIEQVKDEFSRMDWFTFLVCLQLIIEGIGIAVVEKVYERADPGTQRSLDIPIRDETRQTNFGIEALKRIMSEASPEHRAELSAQIIARLSSMKQMAFSLPVPFEKLWNTLGLTLEDVKAAVYERTTQLCGELGVSVERVHIF